MEASTDVSLLHESERGASSTAYLYFLVLVAAVGGFAWGYDLSLISGAIIFLQEEFSLTPFWIGLVAGSATLGCPVGPLAGVWLADTLGQKVDHDSRGDAARPLDHRQRAGRRHGAIQHLAVCGGHGRGSGLDRLAHVHRRGRSGAVARTAGHDKPIGDRHRALHVRAGDLLVFVRRTLALDVRHSRLAHRLLLSSGCC